LIALSCSEPPVGYKRWSLRLLADKAVELEYVDRISHETFARRLKNVLKPWRIEGWVLPPLQNGDFVAQMEAVLDIYKLPYDPLYPVVCMDESPKQLIAETKFPVSAKPGRLARYDYEYRRKGVCNLFIATEPLMGKRIVRVTPCR